MLRQINEQKNANIVMEVDVKFCCQWFIYLIVPAFQLCHSLADLLLQNDGVTQEAQLRKKTSNRHLQLYVRRLQITLNRRISDV